MEAWTLFKNKNSYLISGKQVRKTVEFKHPTELITKNFYRNISLILITFIHDEEKWENYENR